MIKDQLSKRVVKKIAGVGVIGLGYVGLASRARIKPAFKSSRQFSMALFS